MGPYTNVFMPRSREEPDELEALLVGPGPAVVALDDAPDGEGEAVVIGRRRRAACGARWRRRHPATLLLTYTSGTMPRATSRSTTSATSALTIAAPTTVDVGATRVGSPSIVDRGVTHDAAVVDGHLHDLVEPRPARVACLGRRRVAAGW